LLPDCTMMNSRFERQAIAVRTNAIRTDIALYGQQAALTENCQQNNCYKAAYANGNTAERTLNFADFHRLGGTDNVAAAADGNTLGNGVFYFENSAQQWCKHRPLNPCDKHGNNGDACKTSV